MKRSVDGDTLSRSYCKGEASKEEDYEWGDRERGGVKGRKDEGTDGIEHDTRKGRAQCLDVRQRIYVCQCEPVCKKRERYSRRNKGLWQEGGREAVVARAVRGVNA